MIRSDIAANIDAVNPSAQNPMRSRSCLKFVALLFFFAPTLCGSPSSCDAADLVEFLSGAKANGTVRSIRKTEREFELEITVAGRKVIRTYPFSKVHAVTFQGKRYVLTKMPSGSDDAIRRSRDEVLLLIKNTGSTPPDWYEETPLDYPDTLELSWPLKPPTKGWKNKVNVGQYLWDIINPNAGRWKSGVKLIHHIMSTHEDDPVLLNRDMLKLGNMYFELFQDYPRAAFWLSQATSDEPLKGNVHLAECYWRLGNEEMALDLLRGRDLPLQAIKLLGDMGYTERAVSLANRYSQSSQRHVAMLLAGDACRSAKAYDKAIKLYERVLSMGDARNKEYTIRYRGRATDSIEAIRLIETSHPAHVADGTYRDQSVGYNGPLQVELEVEAGRITNLRVTKHKEKQFYAALTDTPNQIMANQSVQDIDGTSGATITSVAIVNATAKALAGGAKK